MTCRTRTQSGSTLIRALYRAPILVALLLAASQVHGVQAQAPPGSFEPVGFKPGRGYFAQLPFEAIDMVAGNLLLNFTDVALPGNGGMSLAVSRTLNYGGANGPVWSIGLAGLPIAIEGASAPGSGTWMVGVLFTGGGAVVVPHQDGVDTYVLDNFMRVTLSTRTVELPNGWIATYESTSGVTEAQLQDVHDAYGNSIHAYWLSRGAGQTTATNINRLELSGGSDPTRTVYLNYDGTGTEVLSLQSEGRTWTYAYGPNQTLTSVTPPAGPSWQFSYDTNAMAVTTPYGGTVSYAFQGVVDSLGHTHPVVTSRTMGGRDVPAGTWQFTFDRSGDPVIGRVDLPDARRLEWQHHAVTGASGVTYWTLAHNSLSRYGVDVAHLDYTYTSCSDPSVPMLSQQTSVQDGRTFTASYSYHQSYIQNCDFHRPYQIVESGELTRSTTQTFTYPASAYRGDLVASTVSTVGAESFEADYSYDSHGFLTSSKTLGVQTQRSPDSAGNVHSVTDPNGHATTFSYQWGLASNTQTPLYAIARTINSDGTVASVTRRGGTTTYGFDALGRVTSVNAPGRTAVTLTYNAASTVTTQGSSVATAQLDGFGRTEAVTTNAGLSQWVQFDALGQVILQSYPADGSTWAADGLAYDDLGRVVSVSHSGGGAITTAYSGATVTVTDENGHATTQHWASFSPSDGRLLSVTDPAGQVWQYAYNGLGSLTSVTQPGGSARTFTYNSRNQLVSETHPESGTTTYAYDDAGNLTTKQDATGTVLTYVYDANNRLIAVQAPGADGISTAYDEADSPTALATGAASTVLAYDTADRLTTRTDTISGHAFVSSYTYDGLDNLIAITYPSGRTIGYDYDAANRITRVHDDTVNYASGITYHPSGRVAALTFGNGTAETTTFDGRYRPVQHTSGPLSMAYTYDLGGNVTQITDARTSYSEGYGYDALDRLVSVTGWIPNGFTYDALGNRTSEANGAISSTYDANLRLVQAGGAGGTSAFTYDAAGRMKTETGASYDYTSYDLLRTATVGNTQASFAYDATLSRVTHSGATGVTYTVRGIGGLVLAEYEDAGATPAPVREYVYVGGRPIASIGRPASAAAPTISVALTSPAAGSVVSAGAPVTLTAQPYLAIGSIWSVEFYANGIYLGSASAAPYTVTATLGAGAWNLQARVLPSAGGVADSATVPVTAVVVNTPPSVSLASPVNSAAFGTGRTATLTANASDSDGIAKVEFYAGSMLIGTVTTAPYSFDWTNLQNGTYTLTAKAYDTLGASTVSAPATITVQPIATVTVSPATPTAGTAALITVDGAAFCSSVNVYFGDGNMQTFMGSSLPISNAYAWATGGPKTITAVGLGGACDNQATASITVLTPPSVSMTAPASGTTYVAPATVALTASATAAQGAIARVDFYANGSLVGSSTSAPYGVTWSNVALGTYGVAAVATDTYGAVATSSTITVIVGTPAPPPSTVLSVTVSPNPGPAWQYATVTVTGTNPCGMLYLDFGDGNWWIAPIDSLPFTTSHLWGTGTYTVTAAGYASCGGVATTSATFTYGAPTPDSDAITVISSGAPKDQDRFDLDALSSGPSDDGPAEEPLTTNVTVWVDLNGTGSGTVAGSVNCAGHATGCSASVPAGTMLTLTATPDAGVSWMGWSGACGGTSSTCQVTASDHLLVVANFRAPVTPVVSYYHLDALGSVRAITDGTGAVVERHDFRPFGEDTQTLPTDGADSLRFIGQPRDQTKLDLFGARYYSMFRGRFNTVDPGHADASLLVPQGWNGYVYAHNNPLRFSDPSGLDPYQIPNCPPGAICGGTIQPFPNAPDPGGIVPGGPGSGWVPPSIPGCSAAPASFRVLALSSSDCDDDGGDQSGSGQTPAQNTKSGSGNGNGNGKNGQSQKGPVTYVDVMKTVNRCAASKANQYSFATMLNLNNIPIVSALTSNYFSTASQIVFGPDRSDGLASGAVNGGSFVVEPAAAKAAGAITARSGYQSLFTSVPAIKLAETAGGAAALKGLSFASAVSSGEALLQAIYDGVIYTGATVACGIQ